MYLYETHMHTFPVSACASSLPGEQVRAYRQRGYAGVIVTDHFVNGNSACPRGLPWERKMKFFLSGYEETKIAGDACGIDVFLGWEFNVGGAEFLTYGLDAGFLYAHPGLDALTVEQYSALVRSHGGFLAQAHPYRVGWWIESTQPVEPDLIDAIEVYNASMPDEINAQAIDFARLRDLPMQAGSDAHHTNLAFTSGIALSKKAESIFDIIEAIKTKQAKLILKDGPI